MTKNLISREENRLLLICQSMEGDPFHAIAVDIANAVTSAAPLMADMDLRQIIGAIEPVLIAFPKSDDKYLQLDFALIRHIAKEITVNHASAYIIPVYHQQDDLSWGHSKITIPWGLHRKRPLHLIYFDRQEGVSPELQSYSWLVHELTHFALAYRLEDFQTCAALTNERVTSWKLASLAVDDSAGRQLIKDFHQYWTPRENQKDWPHEIAVDAICMFLLGPVYALTLYAQYADITSTVNAYQIEPQHIPVELRTQAIIQIGERLGWHREMEPLRELQRDWERQWPDEAQASRYRTLKDGALIRAAQNVGLAYCNQFQLTPLTHASFMALSKVAANPGSLDGTALIIAAWWMWQGDQGGPRYQQWMDTLIQDYAD